MLRSSKDLGRVLALAYLVENADRDGTSGVESWSAHWAAALREHYPDEARELARTAGDGLIRLRGSRPQLEDAHHSAIYGLLSEATPWPTVDEFAQMIPVVMQRAVAPTQRSLP